MIGGRHKSDLGRKGRKKELLGGSVITERLYIDVKQDLKKKKKKISYYLTGNEEVGLLLYRLCCLKSSHQLQDLQV